ncbi:MAG: tRNA preQ1(34) S-adenosylmethionine ribosyltransferase-isomerase QueA [Fuerstia sp.]|nr:tRNA preQ1(34) S-adenosylmethionine ribosyltransferase-isomerase QueA [Fuerstiella sp.]
MSPLDPDQLSTWQFDLPPELIASRPAARRDDSRLLVVDREQGSIQHSHIRELPAFLDPGDLLVFNNTQVLPARLFGFRTGTNGRWEGLFVEESAPGEWIILCDTRGRLLPGETITVVRAYEQRLDTAESGRPHSGSPLLLTLKQKLDDGSWQAAVSDSRTPLEILAEYGSLPLPPYMGRKLADADDQIRYQTAYASEPGAVAAPTAGLHFSPELLQKCRDRGLHSAEVTLHVGIGTFRPVTTERLSEHRMHDEWCRLPSTACDAIAEAKSTGHRVTAVGTTTVRTLESAHAACGQITPWDGRTQLFIRPGYQFQVIDHLLTNFHLPGSTLLVLVAALAGYELTMEAYRKAIEARYRFYSYGDAMLIL